MEPNRCHCSPPAKGETDRPELKLVPFVGTTDAGSLHFHQSTPWNTSGAKTNRSFRVVSQWSICVPQRVGRDGRVAGQMAPHGGFDAFVWHQAVSVIRPVWS